MPYQVWADQVWGSEVSGLPQPARVRALPLDPLHNRARAPQPPYRPEGKLPEDLPLLHNRVRRLQPARERALPLLLLHNRVRRLLPALYQPEDRESPEDRELPFLLA